MEDNQQSLRRKQSAWYNGVKELICGDNEDITVKRMIDHHYCGYIIT